MGNEDVVCRNKCYPANDLAVITNVKRENANNPEKKKDEEDNRVDFVQILPLELVEEVFMYLEPKDLAAATAVSSGWREAVNSNKVWGYICDKKGWKDDFDPTFSHFSKAHKQFRKWAHSYDSFSPICQKRLLYNKHSCLLKNWRCGKYVAHKISSNSSIKAFLQLFEPVTCDGRYLIMAESPIKSQETALSVWSLDGIPSRLCDLPLPSPVKPVEAIAFDFGTTAIIQDWTLIVFRVSNNTFEQAYIKDDLQGLAPKEPLPNSMKRITPHLKVTQDFIICVPNYSHSTVDYIPILFWDRESGELKNSLIFDSMYLHITCAFWSGESCYLSLTNKKTKSCQIVEFSTKSAEWEFFSSTVSGSIEQITASDQYILAVTRPSILGSSDFWSRAENKELWLWDRGTSGLLKTLKTQGKSFQFVDGYLMYFDGSLLTVMNPKDPDIRSEFEVSGTITSIRACHHPSVLVVVKTGCYIEVWDWGLGTRLYTVTAETGYGSQLWCDDKRIITYHSTNREDGCGIMVLGFW